MSIQSLATPAMFMVNAEVFPISRNIAMFRAAARQAQRSESVACKAPTVPMAIRPANRMIQQQAN